MERNINRENNWWKEIERERNKREQERRKEIRKMKEIEIIKRKKFEGARKEKIGKGKTINKQ